MIIYINQKDIEGEIITFFKDVLGQTKCNYVKGIIYVH